MAALWQQPKTLLFLKLRQANRALRVLDFHRSSAATAAADFLVLEHPAFPLNDFRRTVRRGSLAAVSGLDVSEPSPAPPPGAARADGVEGDEEEGAGENGDDDDDEGGEIGAGVVVVGGRGREEIDAPPETISGADHLRTVAAAAGTVVNIWRQRFGDPNRTHS
ncbi:unnamed protein product [Cuscuta campestris]|uniref:Uncharacterized protein n=1 Tax=Cuscuta campestris TaxID=132261 RepID=A0A484M6U2_9ASTE|nr:unnamed protein product [Cuscuta campestris]